MENTDRIECVDTVECNASNDFKENDTAELNSDESEDSVEEEGDESNEEDDEIIEKESEEYKEDIQESQGDIIEEEENISLEHEVFLDSDENVEAFDSINKTSPVLPPIPVSVVKSVSVECQTDISLAGSDGVSSFRPQNLQEQLGPYLRPLPVIASSSAPALLRGDSTDTIAPSKSSGGIMAVQSKSSDTSSGHQGGTTTDQSIRQADDLGNLYKDESRSDLQPTDDETASTYSTISELEGVGPPTILQYIRESTRTKKKVPPPKPVMDRFPIVDPSVERGNMCPFCHTELLPVPPLSDTNSDSERNTPLSSPTRATPGSPIYAIKDFDKGDKTPTAGATSRFSVESPPPIIEDRDDRLPEDGYLYCCEDYYWHLVNKDRMQRRDSFYIEGEVMEVKKIDVSPHAPFGSKAARKVAKDRASERITSPVRSRGKEMVPQKPRLSPMVHHSLTPLAGVSAGHRDQVRERELERVRPTGGNLRAGAGTLFSYARQMKTINFALSSRKCLEDGWTVTNYLPPPKTPEPILYDLDTQSHPLPNLPIPWQQDANGLLHKTYPNGTPFLTILGDGTGTCYYPSGCPAIVITLEQPNLFTYYVLSDSDTSPCLMAVLSQRGRCVVYHPNKGILYHSSPLDGTLFNAKGQRTKYWEWDAFTPHVHAPPFQPICFQMSNYLAMRCVSLEQQSLVFQYRRFTFRCAVGSRTKKLSRKPLPCPQLVMYLEALSETRIKITANLRQLNDAISTIQDISRREIASESRKSPTKSADTPTTSNREPIVV